MLDLMLKAYYEHGTEENGTLSEYFSKIIKYDPVKKEKIYDEIIKYTSDSLNNIEFKLKIYLLSFLILLAKNDDKLLRHIMKIISDDKQNTEYHYTIISNTLRFCGVNLLKPYYEYCYELKEQLKYISNKFLDYKLVKSNKDIQRKKIGIIVDQLATINDSPTKLALDYAMNLKKHHPEYDIKIFVEDNLTDKSEENLFAHINDSVYSKECETLHRNYLNSCDVNIYYSNAYKGKRERTKDIIKEIMIFSPEVILTTSCISLASLSLYKFYPVIYLSIGITNFFTPADIFLHTDKNEVIEINKIYNLIDINKVYKFNYGIDIHKEKRKVQRSEYGIEKNDFVMITIGNRLAAEMSEEFISSICEYLKQNLYAKWIILGPNRLDYLEKEYEKLIKENKIMLISFEEDLAALYNICDIYLNPFRHGGGYSAAAAMVKGIPIITTNLPSDVLYYLGDEFATEPNMDSYIEKIQLYFENKDYRKEIGELMKDKILNLSFEKSIEALLKYIEMAKQNYNARS